MNSADWQEYVRVQTRWAREYPTIVQIGKRWVCGTCDKIWMQPDKPKHTCDEEEQ